MGHEKIHYRADIDGLRAVAILLVVFFHAKLGFRGGYVGVDVFFVISGYLITSIISKELSSGTFSLTVFWERRIRRIWPALSVVVLAVLAAGYFLLLPHDFADLGESALMQAGLAANYHFWGTSGYFAIASDLKPLLHTWSLSVEEQFYLILPLLLLWMFRRSRSSKIEKKSDRVFALLAILAAASFVLASIWVHFDANTAFYWLPHRAWELLLGSCLACLPVTLRPHDAKWRIVASWAGLGMIMLAGLSYRAKTLFPGASALLPCLGACAVIWANLGAQGKLWGAGRVLAWKPLVLVGLMSYSLYLWHWPLLAFARYCARFLSEDAGLTLRLESHVRVGIVVLSLLLAYASWRWIETPVRRRQWLASRTSLFAFGLGSTALCAGLGWILLGTGGFPGRLPEQALSYSAARSDKPEDWSFTWVTLEDVKIGRFKPLGETVADEPAAVMLWGDSHARCLMPALAEWCERSGIKGEAAVRDSMSPTLGYYRHTGLKEDALIYSEAVLERVRSKNIRHTVIAAYWRRCAGSDPKPFQEALKRTVTAIREAGSEVWIVLDVPEHNFDVPASLAMSEWQTWPEDPRPWASTVAEHRQTNKAMYDIVPELERLGARILDPLELFTTSDGRTALEQEGEALYFDSNHLSRKGAEKIAPLFALIFQAQR